MVRSRKNSYNLQNGYCLSYVKSLAQHQHYSSSLGTYFMDRLGDKIADVPLVRRAKLIYYTTDSEFLIMLSWTMATVVMLIIVVFSHMLLNALVALLPTCVTFLCFLWTGLLLKHYTLPFSLSKCLIGSFVLELSAEVIELSNKGATFTSVLCGVVVVVLTFLVLGLCVEDMWKSGATWILLSTVSLLRLLFGGNFRVLQFDIYLSPLLGYVCIFGGW